MIRPRMAALLAAAALVAAAAPAGATPTTTAGCAGIRTPYVPGAAHQTAACLNDLTSAALSGTAHTDPADWAGLAAKGTVNPRGVPGLQLDGYFPDTSRTNTHHGWDHDSQFVLRLPARWNGGLVVTGAPGNRRQYALDPLLSDWALAHGYAFAATDKGNTGPSFYADGRRPGDAVAEWNHRTTQLTRAAKAAATRAYGQAPRRTYMAGISNGGYLTRWQLENHPALYDGGVDWEGTLWTAKGPNPLTSLPTAIAHQLGKATDADLHAAGFPPATEFLWPYHRQNYWGITQKTYRAEFDPAYDPACPGPTAGSTPAEILAPCPSDAAYDYADRPASVHRAVERIALTGRIGKPLLTLHGDLDTLLPIGTDSDVYARMVADQGRADRHRYYTVAGGTHVDGLYDTYPDRLRPLLPCFRSAFDALTAWTRNGTVPPHSGTVPYQKGAVNDCALRTRR